MKNKFAQSNLALLPALEKRWSPRAFGAKAPSNIELTTLFEAARWAASASNIQPWRFIVAKNGTPAFTKVVNGLAQGNQSWASTAPVLVVTLSRKTRTASNGEEKPNPHSWHDLGLAMGNLSAQATHLGLHLHHMAGINPSELDQSFAVNTNLFEVVTVFALGYFSETAVAHLNENQQESERASRQRKALTELVFEDTFETPATWLEGPSK
jgi:nitroreductase